MMKSNFDAELQNNSAPVNETDITDAHIRELTAALAADVPADFTARVMSEIRAERRRISFRHRLLRYGSAAVAALVIVPMAAIVVPAMIRGEQNTDAIPSRQDTVLYDVAGEGYGDVLFSKTPVPEDNGEGDDAAKGTMTTSRSGDGDPSAPEAEVEMTTPAAAPDHMGRPTEDPAGLSSTADSFAADTKYTVNVLTEAPAITVLRSVIGTKKLDNWLAKAEDIDENASRTIISTFEVQKDDFLAAAADLNLSFTQDELNELFGTPLTEE